MNTVHIDLHLTIDTILLYAIHLWSCTVNCYQLMTFVFILDKLYLGCFPPHPLSHLLSFFAILFLKFLVAFEV